MTQYSGEIRVNNEGFGGWGSQIIYHYDPDKTSAIIERILVAPSRKFVRRRQYHLMSWDFFEVLEKVLGGASWTEALARHPSTLAPDPSKAPVY